MVNYSNPVVIERDALGLVKVAHASAGIFIWEFVTTLHYDWYILTGKRPRTPPSMVYLLARFTTLVSYACFMFGFNAYTKYNCKAWIVVTYFFCCVAIVSCSVLLGIRAIALWNKNIFIIIIIITSWVTNFGMNMYGTYLMSKEYIWSNAENSCVPYNTHNSLSNTVTTTVCDVVLLAIMFAGVLHTRNDGHLWWVLCRQGVVWVAAATLSEVAVALLLGLNLNEYMNMILQPANLVILFLAATRSFRELWDISRSVVVSHTNFSNISGMRFKIGSQPAVMSPNDTQISEGGVSIHRVTEVYPMQSLHGGRQDEYDESSGVHVEEPKKSWV